MSDTVFAAICLVLGIVFLIAGIIYIISNAVRGQTVLNGRITDIDRENQCLIIRYRISRDNFADISYHKPVYFFPGAYTPPIGLKVLVTVKKDAPNNPLSVMIQRRYRASEKNYFMNYSRAKFLWTWLGLSLFFILGSIIAFKGVS